MKHPYSDLEGTPLWRAVDAELASLEANHDIQVTTAREYVIGAICRRLAPSDSSGVAIVVDPQYGERVFELATRLHVWLSDTPVNRAAAEAFRSSHAQFDQFSGVTTFRVDQSSSAELLAAQILDMVLEHHGPHSQTIPLTFIELIGCDQTPILLSSLADNDYTEIADTATGWRASLPTAV